MIPLIKETVLKVLKMEFLHVASRLYCLEKLSKGLLAIAQLFLRELPAMSIDSFSRLRFEVFKALSELMSDFLLY